MNERIWASFDFIVERDFEPERLHTSINTMRGGEFLDSYSVDSQTAMNCLYQILVHYWKDIAPDTTVQTEVDENWWQQQFSRPDYRERLLGAVSQLQTGEELKWYEEAASESLSHSRRSYSKKTFEQELLGYLWMIYCYPERFRPQCVYLTPEERQELQRQAELERPQRKSRRRKH